MFDFSIVIPATRNDLLPKCLQSLVDVEYPKNKFEVILILSEKFDNVPKELRVTQIELRELNPALRRNVGVEKAQAPIIAFIDDDVTVERDWMKNAKKLFDEYPSITGLGGPDKIPPGSSFREQITDALLSHKYFGSGVLAHSYYPKQRIIKHGSAIALCNMFIKKADFVRIGGFNVKMGYGGEDTEMIYVLQKKVGATFLYDPNVIVFHKKRPFGLMYFKQRFIFRIKNGKLLWVYPGLYMKKKAFLLFMGGVTAAIVLFFINKQVFGYALLAYLLLLILTSLNFIKKDVRVFVILPFLLFIQHLIYYIGVWIGILHVYEYDKLKMIRR